MDILTSIQKKIFLFVSNHIQSKGMSPTLQEISLAFGYKSKNSVSQHLRLIEKKKFIKLYPGKSRGIQILQTNKYDSDNSLSSSIDIPLIGKIAAGKPILATQQLDDNITVPSDFLGSGEYFALRVSGESMIDVGVHPGDIALIHHQTYVHDGEIAAVIIDGEATLKRFYLKSDIVVLKSENSECNDILISKSDNLEVRVVGKLAGLLKKIA